MPAIRLRTAIAALILLPAAALAEVPLTVTDAHVPASLPMARAGTGYMTITNTGDTPERLMAVEAEFARGMLHETEVEDGIARMIHMERGLEIAPGETVMLEQGGAHIMFMGLTAPFRPGHPVPVTLIFENAGPLEVEFAVRPQGSHGDHSEEMHREHREDGTVEMHHGDGQHEE
ncbi:copper chaperone PCu(A)C [Algicella marina]|uniref:Copper chaperone PCu(A)C n=1 Tax=Algicella marina TaxID=2683284 RepID=A0A6P1T416_9RHOB|nr:copper chaperone PCu(A)C [Algicella marina]QHQ36747.1 copper chaperone PCu(A)C [Algicella marina]